MSSAMSVPDNGLDRPRVSQPHYGRSFFDLQLHFARKVAALSGMPLPRALLEYTNLYVRFGLGRAFDPDHPTWREYLAGLARVDDGVEWTHRFYLTRSEARAGPAVAATFGCFSYALPADGRLRLHFRNAETGGRSPLAIEAMERRMAELRALILHVGQSRREPLQVVGASWLYNLPAYRRLFPDSYLASARVVGGRFQHMPLWGQFVDRYGDVRETAATAFRERVDRQASVGGLEACFPFQVLSPEAPVRDFDAFYGLAGRR
jgi:hypothetical protein